MSFRAAITWCVVLSGIALAVGTVLSRAQSSPKNLTSPRPADAGYVDPTVCARCHPAIAKSYSLTGMGRSVTLPGPENTVEDYTNRNTVYNQPSGLYYTMTRRNGQFYQRRHELGFDGKETDVLEERVDYVIGSGNHCRSYLHRTADGRLIELPITWYAENSGYWAMSPGFDHHNQLDFRRPIEGDCISCHNGFPTGAKYPDRRNADVAIFPKDIPTGIDCQRCHGPGGAHVQAALSGKGSAEIRQAIVNPARLSRARQMDVCMQCHLETDSGLTPNEIRRYGRDLEGYRPGEPLGDFKLFFDRAPAAGKDDRFQIAHQAYRLSMSACYRHSAMTCLTCHDPHQSYRSAESTQHYLAVCEGCHASVAHKVALPAGANCLSCHMPKRRTQDAVHVVMTDHYIQLAKPERDLLAPLTEVLDDPGTGAGVALYYPSQLPQTAENELYLAVAEVKNGANLPVAAARLKEAIAKFAPTEAQIYFELGDAYFKAGDKAGAIRWDTEALRHRGNFRPAIKELAQALIDQGQFRQATAQLTPAVAVAPADAALFAELGDAYLRLGQFDPAQQALGRALELNPEQPEAENFLGMMAVQKGDAAAAEEHFRRAIRNQPDYAEAHNNLGNVLAGNQRYDEAEYHFAKAISFDPDLAEAHHNYGMILALKQDYGQAVEELRKAIALDPRNAETHSDLADLLAPQGKTDEAAAEYRQAIRLKPTYVEAHCSLGNLLAAQHQYDEAKREFQTAVQLQPDFYEAQLGLGMILLREGKTTEAREHCEKALASPDPALRNAAQTALNQMGR